MKKYYKWKYKASQQQQDLCKNQRVKLTETPNKCTKAHSQSPQLSTCSQPLFLAHKIVFHKLQSSDVEET